MGSTGGLNGLLPDILKCCGEPLLDYICILTLFQTVWKERCVPAEWRDAMLVPVPKEGDLSSCDNGRYRLLAYSCYLRVTSVCGRIRFA